MAIPTTMRGVYLTGIGGLDKLVYRDDIPVPLPQAEEVLVKVGACGMNNTDINTRTAWYSKSVTSETGSGGREGFAEAQSNDSTWAGSGLTFPRIQGADVAGCIVGVGKAVDDNRIGERVLIDPWIRDPATPTDRSLAGYFGSERDGGYAEYTTVPSVNAYRVDTELGDSELATFPCSYSTAEYMLVRARLAQDEAVLITGASGGVGSALVQLAKVRGARVIAIAGREKLDEVRNVGADVVIGREQSNLEQAIREATLKGEVDVVADIVGGSNFPTWLDLLARGGRYVTSGAIAGPIVDLDLRTLYLKDLELWGATVMPQDVFARLVDMIEQRKLKPLLAKTFSLAEIGTAQSEFLKKKHVGNFVIVP
ncbi:MAG: alcohol dehydrogenase family protein [Arenicellales bacterium]|nr:alcohol dehydrogenase family protein [Arenicellales bacterium]